MCSGTFPGQRLWQQQHASAVLAACPLGGEAQQVQQTVPQTASVLPMPLGAAAGRLVRAAACVQQAVRSKLRCSCSKQVVVKDAIAGAAMSAAVHAAVISRQSRPGCFQTEFAHSVPFCAAQGVAHSCQRHFRGSSVCWGSWGGAAPLLAACVQRAVACALGQVGVSGLAQGPWTGSGGLSMGWLCMVGRVVDCRTASQSRSLSHHATPPPRAPPRTAFETPGW
jgi:hypothetical protein